MAIRMTLNIHTFIREFEAYGRADQFSVHALQSLFDYLSEFPEDWEMDVVALCCHWCEYDSKDEVQEAYGISELDELDYGYLVTEVGTVLVEC